VVKVLKNDKWILEQAKQGMIEPFEEQLIRHIEDRKVISYGLSSYGYDLRLAPTDFRVFKHIPGTVVKS
jgi:dCTP deaminase